MKPFTSFSIRCSLAGVGIITQLFGCASSYPVKRVSIYNQPDLSGEGDFQNSELSHKVFNQYCQSGKQTKEMKLNVRYVVPKAPPGTPVDEASKILNDEREKASSYIKGTFWYTSHLCIKKDPNSQRECSGPRENELLYSTKDKQADIIGYAKSFSPNLASEVVRSNSSNAAFVTTDDSKTILFFFDKVSSYWHTSTEQRKTGKYVGDLWPESPTVQKAFISDMNLLMKGYTMILSKEFQDQFFNKAQNSIRHQYPWPAAKFEDNSTSNIRKLKFADVKYVGYSQDRNSTVEETSIRAVMDHREETWLRYIDAFTTIKEAPSNDLKIVDYELTLNLDPFCKYARSFDDLISN